jgi:DNA ligase-associated metallophosphoesterase
MVAIPFGGETFHCHADRGLYRPATGTLYVADVHLGKAQQLRRSGIGIPSGSTTQDLARLTSLITTTGARTLTVLGDFLHGALDPADDWLARLLAWRQQHAALRLRLLLGNHDRRLRELPLDAEMLGETATDPPYTLVHAPDDAPADGPALCGHVHPVLRLPAPGRALRLACFWIQPQLLMLPAFGGLTGGWTVSPGPRDRTVVCTPAGALLLPGAAAP